MKKSNIKENTRPEGHSSVLEHLYSMQRELNLIPMLDNSIYKSDTTIRTDNTPSAHQPKNKNEFTMIKKRDRLGLIMIMRNGKMN